MIDNITSLSHDKKYLDACEQAIAELQLTGNSNFKQDKRYNWVLENLTPQDGEPILINILSRYPLLLAHFSNFAKNDLIGNPVKAKYSLSNIQIPPISPTTLRYINVLGHILSIFGPRAITNSIVEIGCGYGGQKFIIEQYLRALGLCVPLYTCIDLLKPSDLQREYHIAIEKQIGLMKFSDRSEYLSYSEKSLSTVSHRRYDFCISNYAFSECYKEVQDTYLQKIILKSKAGYMILNDIKEENKRYDFYTYDELLEMIPNSKLISEEPISAGKNKVLIWGYDEFRIL